MYANMILCDKALNFIFYLVVYLNHIFYFLESQNFDALYFQLI